MQKQQREKRTRQRNRRERPKNQATRLLSPTTSSLKKFRDLSGGIGTHEENEGVLDGVVGNGGSDDERNSGDDGRTEDVERLLGEMI